MEKSTAHEGGIIIKTFVVEEDVAGRDPLRQREKEHMAEPPVRQIAARDALAAHVARRTARTDRQTEHSSTTTTDVSTGTRSSASSSPQAELATPRPATSSQLELYGPRTTILDLLTDSATPSALPQTLGFHISRKARQIAIYNSTHIHLVDTEALPRAFVRTLEVKRRPVALDMLDDGSMLLLLDTPTVLNVYKLNGGDGDAVERKCSIDLQHESKTIAVSADGLVAAVGNQFGVELIALDTTAKRQVSVDRMDSISFSDDGRTLLATSRAKGQGASTTISVAGPYDGPLSLDGIPAPLEVDRAWTSQILFPEKAKTCKHAVLLPDVPFGQSTALFAYNTVEHTWGIYNLEACTFIFSNEFLPDVARWMRQQFIEDALPAVSPSANHVAIAITQHGRPEIWVYRLPRNVEDMQSLDDSDDSEGKNAVLRPCMRIPLPKEEISSSQDLAAMQWLTVPQDSSIERLVVVGSTHAAQAAEDPMSDLPAGATSSGVIIVMDFDLQEQPGQRRLPPQKIVFDLDMLLPGEKLPEDEVVFEREVELLRRRTVAQRDAANRAARRSIAREPTSPVPRVPPMPPRPVSRYDMAGEPLSPIVADADEETLNADEAAVAFEEPYTHAQPRSQASLHRAATVAAASSAARRHLRALPDRPLEYRRADGLREIPHESDADNWVPPPPPYSPNPGPSDAGTVARSPAQGATPQAPAIARRRAPTLPRILVPGAAPAPASIPLSAPGVQAPTMPPQVQAVPQVRAMPQPQAMPVRAQAPSPIPPAAPAQVVTPAPLRSRTNGRRNSRASRSITSLVSALGSSPSPPAEQIQPSLAPSPTPMAANQVPILSSPSPSTLQPRRTFPRQGGDPNPAANLVPNPDGSGLRRSSNTFPTPAELRNSRPLPPTPTPLQPRHMDIFEYQGPWSRAGAGGQEASAYNEAVTARASTLLDRAHSPYTPKQEKKSARCVIM